MRKALIVGINHYEHIGKLRGCVNDAQSVKAVLERNFDGTANFPAPYLMTGTSAEQVVRKHELRRAVRELLASDAEIALFYFAGHGYVDDTGGFLCASDAETGDDGLSLQELMTLANNSRARNKIIILDSCHSGVAGNITLRQNLARITDGVTILTASTAEQPAREARRGGVFTRLLVNALNGAAANLLGDVTPSSVFAHIDQSLGPWAQRPVYKANVQTFVSLRRAEPAVALTELWELADYFPTPDHKLSQDAATFRALQTYLQANLVRPASMEHHSYELTTVGRYYRDLAHNGLI